MKLLFKIITVLVGLVVVLLISGMMIFYAAGKSASQYVGDFKPAATLADGNYHGTYSCLGGHISADVSFQIKDGKLYLIRFDKLYGTAFFGSAQKVYYAIDDQKNLDFDVVTGATITSNLAKAAIKNALQNGPDSGK